MFGAFLYTIATMVSYTLLEWTSSFLFGGGGDRNLKGSTVGLAGR